MRASAAGATVAGSGGCPELSADGAKGGRRIDPRVLLARAELLAWTAGQECRLIDDKRVVRAAVKRGNLSALQLGVRTGCWALSFWLCERAARAGKLSVLKWAREHGCPWDEDTLSGAPNTGHLDVLPWSRGEGCP
eukprot:jgi/Tetstr1/428799/TSEL_018786.t1